MADPLSLLRHFTINRKDITEQEDWIIFDQFAFLKSAKTNYVMCKSSPKDYYTLGALVFFLKNVTLTHPAYVQKAASENVQVVRFPDRKDILAYLNGEKETASGIDKSVPLEMPQTRPDLQGSKRISEDHHIDAAKRSRYEDDPTKTDLGILAGKLEGRKESAITADQLLSQSGLSQVMSVDQIAQLKRKRLAIKKTAIQGSEMDDLDGVITDPILDPSTDSSELDVAKDITSKERPLRTRTSIMQSSGKQFYKSICTTLAVVKDEVLPTVVQPMPAPQAVPLKAQPQPVDKKKPNVAYNRYDQELFSKKEETEGFKIDTVGTYHGLSFDAVKDGVHRPGMASPARSTSSRTQKPSILPLGKPSGMPTKRESKVPIIILSTGVASLISLANVKDLLQDCRFVTIEEKKRQGLSKDTEVLIHRKKDVVINGQTQSVTVPFRCVDQPLKLTPNDWNRVCAVFVHGATWQFKGWPIPLVNDSPVEIFTKVRGFHLKYDNVSLDPNIKRWDVEVLEVSQFKRHMDRACAMRFWEVFDKFMIKNKPHLRY